MIDYIEEINSICDRLLEQYYIIRSRAEKAEKESSDSWAENDGLSMDIGELADKNKGLKRKIRRLQERCIELLKQRNGWAEKRHASWCCGSGEMCCCGHEEVKKQSRKSHERT